MCLQGEQRNLLQRGVNADRRKVAVFQQLRQLDGSLHFGYENNHLSKVIWHIDYKNKKIILKKSAVDSTNLVEVQEI